MKRKTTILVPTDFSAASRAAMRFAIQWASQQRAKLIITHVLDSIKFADWNKKKLEAYTAAQRTWADRRLRRMASDMLRRTNTPAKGCDTRLVEGTGTGIDKVLADFGRLEDIDFICMGTNGTGTLQRLLGTNTGNVIRRSEVPVIAVPAAYRSKPIKRILYATDLTDYPNELKRVQAVARGLGAEIDVLHFLQTGEPQPSDGIIYRLSDPTASLAGNLQNAVRSLRPSMVVMFTDHRRSWFRRLVYPSQTERMCYNLSVPLLVMTKR